MQLQFSLLSKKGLRYLLYPFISLWIVGGRISPSFTSALSKELSNSLRTKAGKRERGEETRKYRWVFYVTSPRVFFLIFIFFIFSDFTRSRSLHSPWLLTQTKVVNWVPWQIFSLKREYREGRGGRLKWKYRAGEWMTAHTRSHAKTHSVFEIFETNLSIFWPLVLEIFLLPRSHAWRHGWKKNNVWSRINISCPRDNKRVAMR